MAANAVFDAAAGAFGNAVDCGEVDFGELAVAEGFGEAGVGEVVFGGDEAAAGFFVEAVDDAGSEFAADAAEVVAVEEEGVDEGAVGIACSGVDDEAGGFVDDDEVFIFKKDIKGDVLGDDGDGGGIGNVKGDLVAELEMGVGFGGEVVEAGFAVFNEGLDAGAGEVGELLMEKLVESLFDPLRIVDGKSHGMDEVGRRKQEGGWRGGCAQEGSGGAQEREEYFRGSGVPSGREGQGFRYLAPGAGLLVSRRDGTGAGVRRWENPVVYLK